MQINTETKAPYNATTTTEQQEDFIIAQALAILEKRTKNNNIFINAPQVVKNYLITKMAQEEREGFGVIYLNNQHQVIFDEILFQGTIASASVYPREVVKASLKANAAAVIFYHNHPSGVNEPSQADKDITEKLNTALQTVDIRVLDHIIVAGVSTYSFAENGLL